MNNLETAKLIEMLKKAYQAFNMRDIDTALSFMHPEVDWANGMEGGWVHGREGVRGYWTRQWTLIDPHVEPVQINREDISQIVVDVYQVVRDLKGNVLSDQMVQHVYSMEDGLIRRMDIRK